MISTENVASDAAANAAERIAHPEALAAARRVSGLIAPTWPLDRWIAVNPLWQRIDEPVQSVSARWAALTGEPLVMARPWYRAQFDAKHFDIGDVERAIAEDGGQQSPAFILRRLEESPKRPQRIPTFADHVSAARGVELAWSERIADALSAFCGEHFAAREHGRPSARGLFATWQDSRCPVRDALGLRGERVSFTQAIERSHKSFAFSDVQWQRLLEALLLEVHGWASFCAYQRQVDPTGPGDDVLELLAMRLRCEHALFERSSSAERDAFRRAFARAADVEEEWHEARRVDWIAQRALERGWTRRVASAFWQTRPEPTSQKDVAAVFCIDVRSEVFRRALEGIDAGVATRGFAGFFGLPVEYRSAGADHARPHLPGLLRPSLVVSDGPAADAAAIGERGTSAVENAWTQFSSGAISSFGYVDALGLAYGASLALKTLLPGRRGSTHTAELSCEPSLERWSDGRALSLSHRVDLAEGVLRAMGLVRCEYALVLLCGHAAQTTNNPQAAGLDCGACCGNSGEANARAAAALLNDTEVRFALTERGISLGEAYFIAGLHQTTSDEVTLFDVEHVPHEHRRRIEQLRVSLAGAGIQARRERSSRLALSHLNDEQLFLAMRRRGDDWAEVRPEWGLARNAAFIVAPRERTRALNLEGRVFLHDYDSELDVGFKTLELIMTAPMLVTHWINLQYYCSTVAPERLGSGSKLLHNVVGEHLGVLEGARGDLRIGLPLQSVHNGKDWEHIPMRLAVFIEAPRAAIEAILQKHATVRHLVENQWLFLYQLDAAARKTMCWHRNEWREETA